MSSSSNNNENDKKVDMSKQLNFNFNQHEPFKSGGLLHFANNPHNFGSPLFNSPYQDQSLPSHPVPFNYSQSYSGLNLPKNEPRFNDIAIRSDFAIKSQPSLLISVKSSDSAIHHEDVKQETEKIDEIIFIPSKIPLASFSSAPEMYNEHSSCTIPNKPDVILTDVCNLLDDYSNEIEYNINKQRQEIEGVIFIRHRPISWIITIWSISNSKDNQNDVSRVEFQKRRGDSIDFQRFWSDMLKRMDEKFQTQNVNDAQRCDNFQELFMPTFDLQLENDDAPQLEAQLNEFNEQLCDDFHEIALDALGLLCTRLEKEKDLPQAVSKHQELMKTLTNNVLNHVDASHVRGGLFALHIIVTSNDSCIEQLLNQNILSTIIPLLSHKKALVCKHAVRLLAALSKKEWFLPNDRTQIQQQLRTLQGDWHIQADKSNNNDFVSWKMFEQIEKRVQKSAQPAVNKLNSSI